MCGSYRLECRIKPCRKSKGALGKPNDSPALGTLVAIKNLGMAMRKACANVWHVPAMEETLQTASRSEARMTRDPTWTVLSPCGRKVVFARFIETLATPAWQTWMHETLGLGDPSTHFIEVFVLDSRTLAFNF